MTKDQFVCLIYCTLRGWIKEFTEQFYSYHIKFFEVGSYRTVHGWLYY